VNRCRHPFTPAQEGTSTPSSVCKFSCRVRNNDAELIGKGGPERQFYHHRTLNQSTMNTSRDLTFQHVRGPKEPRSRTKRTKIEEEISQLNRNRTAAARAETWSPLDSNIISVLTNDGHHSILNSDRKERYSRRHSVNYCGDSTPHPPPGLLYWKCSRACEKVLGLPGDADWEERMAAVELLNELRK